MSNQATAKCVVDVVSAVQPPADLCGRVYRRNYAAHQAVQQSICDDWAALLQDLRS